MLGRITFNENKPVLGPHVPRPNPGVWRAEIVNVEEARDLPGCPVIQFDCFSGESGTHFVGTISVIYRLTDDAAMAQAKSRNKGASDDKLLEFAERDQENAIEDIRALAGACGLNPNDFAPKELCGCVCQLAVRNQSFVRDGEERSASFVVERAYWPKTMPRNAIRFPVY